MDGTGLSEFFSSKYSKGKNFSSGVLTRHQGVFAVCLLRAGVGFLWGKLGIF
jgi:hypothetical protein